MADGLAARAWRVAARAAAAAVSATNVLARPTAGWVVGSTGDLARPASTTGWSVTGRLRAVVDQIAGWNVAARASGTAMRTQTVGRLASIVGVLARPTTTRGLRVSRISYTYTGTRTGSGGREYAVAGRTDWNAQANANGPRDGTLATFVGDALAARAGGIDLDLPVFTGKTALTITSVKLRFYLRQAGTMLANGTLKYGYRSSTGTRTQLAAPTGNTDGLIAPLEHDLTAVIGGDWSKFGTTLAGAYVETSTAVGNTSSADLDAVELVVLASLTETP